MRGLPLPVDVGIGDSGPALRSKGCYAQDPIHPTAGRGSLYVELVPSV